MPFHLEEVKLSDHPSLLRPPMPNRGYHVQGLIGVPHHGTWSLGGEWRRGGGIRTQVGRQGTQALQPLHGFDPSVWVSPEAVGCREDPVGVQDAPPTDVLFVVLDADLPRPRIHRGRLPANHPRGLQALPTGWRE